MKKNFITAFTLAEVLITLGVIGIIAAITIPGLITAYKAHQLHSQFLESYSTVQQFFRQMIDDEVSLDPKTYTNNSFYSTFKNYVKVAVDCGNYFSTKNNSVCYTKTSPYAYKTLDGKQQAYTEDFDDGQLLLMDGTTILIENPGTNRTWIHVDLNGFKNPPNRWGIDLFTFDFKDGELLTMGDKGSTFTDQTQYCNINVSNNRNGIACAHRAKTETDYFKWVLKNTK